MKPEDFEIKEPADLLPFADLLEDNGLLDAASCIRRMIREKRFPLYWTGSVWDEKGEHEEFRSKWTWWCSDFTPGTPGPEDLPKDALPKDALPIRMGRVWRAAGNTPTEAIWAVINHGIYK